MQVTLQHSSDPGSHLGLAPPHGHCSSRKDRSFLIARGGLRGEEAYWNIKKTPTQEKEKTQNRASWGRRRHRNIDGQKGLDAELVNDLQKERTIM